jgi:hypothetical protein
MATNVTKSVSQIQMDLKKQLHNDLYEFFVCQNCETVPKEGPIYTCTSGDHATCNNCFQTSKVCKCNDKIHHPSKVLEKIRTTLPLSCQFRKNGCNTVLTLDFLVYHEVDCPWRTIFCPVLSCALKKNGTNVIFNALDDHVTESHNEIIQVREPYLETKFNIPEKVFTWTSGSWRPTKITAYEQQQFFFIMTYVSNRFFFWVYYHGSKEETKNYYCAIKVYGNDEKFVYNGLPRSLDESRDELVQGEFALIIGGGQIKRMLSKVSVIQCSVQISCPKIDEKEEDFESGISDNDDSIENTTSENR